MKSEKLSLPLSICGITIDEAIEKMYSIYVKEIMPKEKRPELFGKFIYINSKEWIDQKAEMFWHMISLGDNEKFNIYPCNNLSCGLICEENCKRKVRQISIGGNRKRNICLYRGTMISWLIEIIALANNKDSAVQVWVKEGKLHLRMVHETVDYIAIFEIKKNMYVLITAYPVFYISSKRNYTQDYYSYKNKNR